MREQALQMVVFLLVLAIVGQGVQQVGLLRGIHEGLSRDVSWQGDSIASGDAFVAQDELDALRAQVGISEQQSALGFKVVDAVLVSKTSFGELSGRHTVIVQDVAEEVKVGDALSYKGWLVGEVQQMLPGGSARVALLGHESVRPAIQGRGESSFEGVVVAEGGELQLQHVSDAAAIEAGTLRTSGLDGVYPRGLAVANLTTISDPDRIRLNVSWRVDQLEVLYVVR